jgi:hypothetical protein
MGRATRLPRGKMNIKAFFPPPKILNMVSKK